MASSVTLLGPQFNDGGTYTSLLMRQLTGNTRVADAGTPSAVASQIPQALVARAITSALAAGWEPLSRGKTVTIVVDETGG